jgi:hypothetical protein
MFWITHSKAQAQEQSEELGRESRYGTRMKSKMIDLG